MTYEIGSNIGAELMRDEFITNTFVCEDETIKAMAEETATEQYKIEMKSIPTSTSTTDKMDAKLAMLSKELETYLALFRKSPPTMMEKSAFLIEDTEWGKDRFTHNELFEYIRGHSKVDGNDWCCGEFGNRWADTIINGKMVRLVFTTRKFCPEAFLKLPGGKTYQILVDVQGDAEDKKAKKHRKSAEEYTETRQKAIQHSNGFQVTNNAEMRKLLKTVVEGRRKSRGETCFYWHRGQKQVNWGNNDEIRDQAKLWKKAMKDGDRLQFLESNCQTKLVNGEEWKILVCGNHTSDFGIDPLGTGIDDGCFIVSGLIYWFKHKESRDAIFKYLTA